MRYISVEEVLAIHDYQIERFGGTQGLISLPLLESAVSRPTTNISGKDMYQSVYEKAAVLTYSLIKNHPFLDGNKRTGLHSALTFLELNGFEVVISQKLIVKFGLNIANSKTDLEQIVATFNRYSRSK